MKPTETDLGKRILHFLSIYPVISPSMLQAAIGPQVKPELWRPILDELLDEGLVLLDLETSVAPSGRHNSYKRLMLRTTFDKMNELAGTYVA